MAVVANWRITTIDKGRSKTYFPGEVITELGKAEEQRLLEQGAATFVVTSEGKKTKSKKKDGE